MFIVKILFDADIEKVFLFSDKPVCKNEPLIVGAPLNHSINVKCEVDAFPIPGNFLWTLNTSTGMVEFDSVSDENSSELMF